MYGFSDRARSPLMTAWGLQTLIFSLWLSACATTSPNAEPAIKALPVRIAPPPAPWVPPPSERYGKPERLAPPKPEDAAGAEMPKINPPTPPVAQPLAPPADTAKAPLGSTAHVINRGTVLNLTPATKPSDLSQASSPDDAAATTLPPGHYAVQVGVFHVERNASALRERVVARLAQEPSLATTDRRVRIIQLGQRHHVLVGSVENRSHAQSLAARLRVLLNQDVVVFQR
ncbi:MAG TPA: SPOR domain-containing protein [Burkholderiaceae bacterium]|nr:SPOR domain-containing protein [Burkholderiaceae bacterium]